MASSDRAVLVIDDLKEELKSLSEKIWENPELNFEEHKAHAFLTDYLESKGFEVTRGYCGLPTAFKATAGTQGIGVNVCVICEYDALPGIGHACGHNLIAEAGVAAGLGLKASIDDGSVTGCVTIIGTPAEEGGGGKVELIAKGGFDGVDIALMVHPSSSTCVNCHFLAISQVEVTYKGKAAHAAAFPWEGVNAVDAAVLAYTNISALRQQMKPSWRVHGVITNGGAKPNIIPEKAVLCYYIRAPTKHELQQLKARIMECFEGAATATNCTVEIVTVGKDYENVLTNPILGKLYEKHLWNLGYDNILPTANSGSTDMGNVSHVVPSIHPKYGIGDGTIGNHTRGFTTIANEPKSHELTLVAAKAMVLTGLEVMANNTLLPNIKEIFFTEKDVK